MFLRVMAGVFCVLGIAATGCSSAGKKSGKLLPEDRASLLEEAAAGALNEADPIGALQILQEVETINPNRPGVHHLKALAYFRKNDLVAAIKSAERARVLAPEDSAIANTLGKLYFDAGRLSDAEPLLLEAGQNPLYREAYKARTTLGILYYRRGELGKSRQQLDLAIQAEPLQGCVAHYYRGHLRMKERDFASAVSNYKQATTLRCGRFVEAHFAVAVAFAKNRQFDQARKKYLEVKQLFPESPLGEKAMEQLRTLP